MAAPTFAAGEIDVWNAEAPEVNGGALRKKQRNMIEMREKEIGAKFAKCREAAGALTETPGDKRPIIGELRAGAMAATAGA